MASAACAAPVVYTNVVTCSSLNVTFVWTVWNNSYTTAGTDGSGYGAGAGTQFAWADWNEAYQETVEQRALREQLEREWRAEEAVRAQQEAARAEAAKACAEALLLANLDEAQAAEFRQCRHFVVHSRDRARRYRVEYGIAGNIKLLGDQGLVVASFCIHPDMKCPTEDVMLAQKLMIECDEEQFLKIANRRAA